MIRIVERSPRARALSYRARLRFYAAVHKAGRRLRRWGVALSWYGDERAHALSTGRTVRR